MGPVSPHRDVLRPHPALFDIAAGRGLPKVSDPMPMLRSAMAHGMSGLLLTEVERTDQSWRRLVLGLLRARQVTVEAWHQRLWNGLDGILAVFDDMGVEVAIAKGVAAEARWYSRLGERPCNDLDLLIAPSDLHRIDDIIAAVEPSHPLCGKTRRLAEEGFLQSIDLDYCGVPIDLHWDIMKIGIPSRNCEAIWERTVSIGLPSGRSIRTLDPGTSWVHFLVHLNKDRFRRLLGFVDAARVYEHEELDHDAVDRLIAGDGIKTCVDVSWNIVVSTLELSFPTRRTTPGIQSLIWHYAWRPSIRLRAQDSKIRYRHRQYLIALLSRGRTIEAIRSWVRGRFPPAELLAYVHSEYARRWGGETVSDASHSRLWSLTIGRLWALFGRRRQVAQMAQLAGHSTQSSGK